MSKNPVSEIPIEPERYELYESGSEYDNLFKLTRRQLLKNLGGGLVVLLIVKDALSLQESGGSRRFNATPQEVSAWLHISEDGVATVYTGKVEVGQNIRTSLTQVVAEELKAPESSIRMVMGDTDLTPFDMGTFGSRTTPVMAPQLRKAAASARELLIDLAAEQWQTDRSSISVADGKVVQLSTKKSLDFGELTKGKKLMKIIEGDVPTTPVDQWKVAGKSKSKVNGREMVTGRHKYTSDVKRPQMWYGKVLRPSALNASLISLDTKQAEGMKDVVVARDGNFVGVAASNEHIASLAISSIEAEWKTSPQISAKDLFDHLKISSSQSENFRGSSNREKGSIENGLSVADKKLERSYTIAYIAHAPLEPRAAVAEWKEGKLTVWTGTQRPFGVRSEVSKALGISEDQVRIIVPDTGSGYGGKHTGEAAIEAARLAQAAGKPVKIVWTREEEFTWAYFRPAGAIDIISGVKNDGSITAWEFHNYNSGSAAIGTLYDIPNQKIEFHSASAPLRQGSYRSLAATANHFARETHMDELARTLKLDPLEFRYKNLKDERLKAVFEAAADRFGWGSSKPKAGRGFGIAGGFDKGGYLATCAEVSTDQTDGKVKVVRLVSAFECGAVINPDQLKNQIEGAMIMGLGGALFEAVEFENGRVLNPRFSHYRVPRFSDTPLIEVVLVDRKDLPSAGAGETPIVGVAPAVGNAIFEATGVRIRSLPMAPNGLKIM